MIPILFPMGASSVNEKKLKDLWTHKDWVGEQKYDGARYLIRKDNGKVSVVSRTPSVKDGLPVDKTENVPHFVDWFQTYIPDNTVIDGEIITHELGTSNQVTSIMGSKPERALKLQQEDGWVQYVMFDVLFWDGKDLTKLPYHARRKILEKIYKEKFGGSRFFKIAKLFIKENLEKVYQEIVNAGGEGLILKNLYAPYEYSLVGEKHKRPKNTWVKVKKYKTYDCIITGFTEPTKEYKGKEIETWQYWYHAEKDLYTLKQNVPYQELLKEGFEPVTKDFYMGWIGAIKYGQMKEGKLIEIGQTDGIEDEIKAKISANREKFIGEVIEIGAFRQNKKTHALVHPRFIRFRPDKTPSMCEVEQ